jgi:hypothetical protein
VRPMLRIKQTSDGDTTTLRLGGRVQSEDLTELWAQVEGCSQRMVIDIEEVTFADPEAVQFLGFCQEIGIELLHCPPDIRESILAENHGDFG